MGHERGNCSRAPAANLGGIHRSRYSVIRPCPDGASSGRDCHDVAPMSPGRTRLLVLLAVAAAALPAAGCGDDDNSSSATTDTTATQTQTQTQPTTTPEQAEAPKARKVKPAAGEADPDRKPKVPKGRGDAPTELVVQDLIVGKGKRAKAGDTVSVQYVGVLFENGKQFDASWKGSGPGQAFQFPLGGGQVIPGWDQGVVGMREGGRRKLIIPPDLAYGAQGFPPDIPANAALIFDIDLEQAG
jgi:peptidylprolyl isomerase